MILDGGLILQALAGGCGGGGKVNMLDMCDLFEQQTPITTIPFFGDYSAKLCIMPDGTYYNRYRQYQFAGNAPAEDVPVFASYEAEQKDFCTGIYRGNTLLYLNDRLSSQVQPNQRKNL